MIGAVIDRLYVEKTGAVITPCGRYRYLLWRRWAEGHDVCVFIGLNPSTADGKQDDPTVRRMVGFARFWGYGELWVLNAYAWRSTNPKALRDNGLNAVGPLNNEYIRGACAYAGLVVAAWGNLCDDMREHTVRGIVKGTGRRLYHLGLTGSGHPRHPLYLRGETRPIEWE